ncbi:MAG: recombinase family protein [Bacteroidia bacterium]
MTNAILYARVSTDEQAAKGTSIPYQKERLEQFCTLTGYNVVKYVAEDYSAKNFDNRPEFNNLLNFIRANKGLAQKLLIVRWDRFSRNAPEAYNMIAKLAKMGIEVNAIEQPLDLTVPENKMMLAFYLAAPEVENDRRAINTINGIRKNKKQGRWLGLAPLGYKNMRDGQNKPIIVKSELAPLVKKAFELFATGNYPIDALRKKMYIDGLKLCRNQFWRLLRNPVYCGLVKLKAYRNEPEEIIQGIHEPIITEGLFYDVQRVLEGKKRVLFKVSKVREEFPMRGFLICGSCGGNLTASCSQGRNEKYYYYHCQSGCKERIGKDLAHSSFTQWLEKIALSPEMGALYLQVMEDIFKTNGKDREAEVLRLETEIKRNNETLDRAAKKLVNDELDKDSYKSLRESLLKETADLKLRIAELKDTDNGYLEYLRFGFTLLGNLPYHYNKATLEIKQRILGSIFSEKLIFSENTYRTAQPSDIIELLYTVNGAFGGWEKGKAVQKNDFSLRVARRATQPY